MSARIVTSDGWPYEWRAYIVAASWFGKPRWRFVIEKKWVYWRYVKTSRRYPTKEAAQTAANRWLDGVEQRTDKDFVIAGVEGEQP